MDGKLVLGYWGVQGLAHPTRYLLAYHKIDWEDKQYKDAAEWFDVDKKTIDTFPNLPYIKDGDTVVTESVAVIQYAAFKTGNTDLLGKNRMDSIKIYQCYGVIDDLNGAILKLAKDQEYDKVRDTTLKEKIVPYLKKLSAELGDKEYLLGYLTWVDFVFFNALDLVNRMNSETLKEFSNLVKYHEKFYENENIRAFRKSEKYPRLYHSANYVKWTGEDRNDA